MKSCVLILPEADRAAGNALAETMGWGPNNYSVPLSADGSEPATHWGLHAWVADSFDPDDFAAVTGSLIASIRDDYPGHFAEVCEANGLCLVEQAEV